MVVELGLHSRTTLDPDGGNYTDGLVINLSISRVEPSNTQLVTIRAPSGPLLVDKSPRDGDFSMLIRFQETQ